MAKHHYPKNRKSGPRGVYQRRADNKTGVVGVVFTTKRADFGFMTSHDGRFFNLRTLGKEEAKRQAIRHRAQHELSIRSGSPSRPSRPS